jgi:NADH-quinone oxidoreductase subunit J
LTLFWILGVLLVVSAIFVITQRKPVYSVVGLLLHFAVLAVFYLTLNAEFLAVIQIVIYSGAILILFVFVIALLSSGVAAFSVGPNRMPKAAIPSAALALAALALLVYGISRAPLVSTGVHVAPTSPAGAVGAANVFGSVADFGKALFTTHLLPFEITAFILMVSVIGVVALAGESAPYVPSLRHARTVDREMREAILRGGEQ